jgi:hypothetical protein
MEQNANDDEVVGDLLAQENSTDGDGKDVQVDERNRNNEVVGMAPKTNTSGSHAGPFKATSIRRIDSNRTLSRKSRNLAGIQGRVVVLISDACQKN